MVIINEIIDLAKKRGKDCLIFMVDFEKAYDSVRWDFLDYMLGRFGFNEKWKSWIREGVFSGKLSLSINGSPMEEMNIQRGLKQGDPLAPFLFLLVVEGLSGLLKNVASLRKFKGFKVCNSDVTVSHLQYVDDTILIGEACEQNLWVMKFAFDEGERPGAFLVFSCQFFEL